jgi:metallo-beta-lactamase class B
MHGGDRDEGLHATGPFATLLQTGRPSSMRLFRLIALASALLAAPGNAPAQTIKDLLGNLRRQWNTPTEPFRVIGNVYYVGTAGLAAYLITGPSGHVLIDTVMPEATSQIRTNVEKLGFRVADIKLLLNTHAHIDHTGGFAELKKETGAELVTGEKDKPIMEGGYYPGAQAETALNFPAASVDRTVRDRDVVTLGPIRLTAHATPGHSPGCTTWTTSVEEAGREHGVIFFCSATVALNRLAPNPTYPGIVEDYERTFATAPGITGDVFLAPHPEMYGMAAKRARMADGTPNPFVAPGEFQAYLAALKSQFEAGLAKQRAAAR